ncbi:hypothetical protein D6C77_07949 [Aureobasidium pullulans]|nr:hypothetical protein D6C77_07949 [Aureobasidium pullulans]
MTSLLSLPPELRVIVFNLLVEDAINDQRHVVARPDAVEAAQGTVPLFYKREKCIWHQTSGACEFKKVPYESPSCQYICMDALFSLAMTNKLLYAEVAPIIWSNANYTVRGSPTAMLTTMEAHLGVLGSTAIANINHINLVLFADVPHVSARNGAREVRQVTKLISDHLPNLRKMSISVSNNHDLFEPFNGAVAPSLAVVEPLGLISSHVDFTFNSHSYNTSTLQWLHYSKAPNYYTQTIINMIQSLRLTMQRCCARATKRRKDRLVDHLLEAINVTIDLRRSMFDCTEFQDRE